MSVFSERLAECRREKNIAQKTAAVDLGISPALLSHYEKGIRECGPAFIAKAAAYYDVSADYLLGLSDSADSADAVFAEGEQPMDGEFVSLTVYRALARLGVEAAKLSPEYAARVLGAYEFALYKLICTLNDGKAMPDAPMQIKGDRLFYVSVAENAEMRSTGRLPKRPETSFPPCPVCIQTVIRHCEERIRTDVEALKKELEER